MDNHESNIASLKDKQHIKQEKEKEKEKKKSETEESLRSVRKKIWQISDRFVGKC
jgi:hypothetical protein